MSLSAALFYAVCRLFVLCFPLFCVVRLLVCFSISGLVVVRLVFVVSLSLLHVFVSVASFFFYFLSLCVSDRTLFDWKMYLCTCILMCACASSDGQI